MRIRIQRTRCWRLCGPSKPVIVRLDGSRGRSVVHVHRRDSLDRKIQPEITKGLPVREGLIQTDVLYIANAQMEGDSR